MAGREGKRGECQTAFGFWFGAKPARSETPAGAAAKRRPPERGRSGEKMRSLHRVERRISWCRYQIQSN